MTNLELGLSVLAAALLIVLGIVLLWSHRYRRTQIQLTLEVVRDIHAIPKPGAHDDQTGRRENRS